ncbi:TNF receptor-associated factor 6 [Drosophila serrata]|uniref:TNF receptor-associated factor 6 n=1 Tax=Drosophila serrata TaxID=7274 RepID=UPI000A1D1E8C|nr:TNF receptor-associated factor 6 [Drosophila serrata]
MQRSQAADQKSARLHQPHNHAHNHHILHQQSDLGEHNSNETTTGARVASSSSATPLAGANSAPTPPRSLAINQNHRYAASDTSGDQDQDHDHDQEQDEELLDSRYECAICIDWLNEPVLTSCGHRFCRSCLTAWLQKNNQCCPLDNKCLSAEHDIFPDNYTRREIEQLKHKCPNSPLGCSVVASPIELHRHLPSCPYRRQLAQDPPEEKCPFAKIKCDFVGRPETNQLEEHLKADMPHHMQLMLQAFQQTAIATWQPHKPSTSGGGALENGHGGQLPAPPQQYANGGMGVDEQIVQTMYQRIVVLEQRTREQETRLENLQKQLRLARQSSSSSTSVDPRYSNGTIVWRIEQLGALVARLRANANNLEYSRECYTSPHGYKFCARLNIQPRKPHVLSLHVHLMQSENDYHLDWPFKGRIKLCMVHPVDASLSQHDTIMTKPEILAFHKPREAISTRGFGFLEYANISNIIQLGFCADDRLLIKIEINIV